jgi:hypothetical protein
MEHQQHQQKGVASEMDDASVASTASEGEQDCQGGTEFFEGVFREEVNGCQAQLLAAGPDKAWLVAQKVIAEDKVWLEWGHMSVRTVGTSLLHRSDPPLIGPDVCSLP